jgi:hypothetical protein
VSRGLGYRPVPAGVREDMWHMHPMATRGMRAPDRDLTVFAPDVDDQDGVGQCTGNAVTCAVMATLAAAGTPVDAYLDPQSAYRLARCLDRSHSYPWSGGTPPALEDVGADPNLVYLAGNKFGFAALKDTFGYQAPCPELTAAYGQRRNEEPMLGELQDSDAFKAVGQQRVLSTGQQRIDDVRTALAAGFAVTMSVHASDYRFQGYVGGVMPPAPEGQWCNHLVCIVGDFTDTTEATVFIVQNSWSTLWGMGGRFWAHSGILLQSDGIHVASVRKA